MDGAEVGVGALVIHPAAAQGKARQGRAAGGRWQGGTACRLTKQHVPDLPIFRYYYT